MAHFIGYVQGGRGEASRVGHKSCGLTSSANGWNSGVRVDALVDETGQDVFNIYATTGSGFGEADGFIGRVIDGKFIPTKKND